MVVCSSSIHSFILNSHPNNFQNNPRLYQINQLTFDCVLRHDSALKWVWLFCWLSLSLCSGCITVYLSLNQVVRWNNENDSVLMFWWLCLLSEWSPCFKKVWHLLPRLMTSFVRECMTLACPMLNGLRGYQNRRLLIKDEWLPLFKGKWSRGYWNKWPLLSRINVFRLSKSKWPPRVLK